MATYVHYGILLISVSNLAVIGLMLVVFALAVWLRMPGARQEVGRTPRRGRHGRT